ncbi:N-acetylglucosamine kinase [Arthrobacter sulfonylureivorans]|uniref:N-acetylglucosamine kinase n=1 Tax=Arthrobacter sulfonylureivorans TaxID=2486855 RepID=UPI0039E264E6
MVQTLIGLDIGGSKTHGIRLDDGRVVAEATAGSANVQNASPAQAAAALSEVFGRLGAARIAAVYAGAGGIDTDGDAAALRALLAPLAPGAAIHVVHDTRLVLAAGHRRTGIGVVAGTGSSVWGVNDAGEEARAGGWGHLLGDEGSGYWLGREAVRHALSRLDAGLQPDRLTALLLADCGLRKPVDLIAMFHSPQTDRRFWADKSRVVVAAAEEGEEPAAGIIDRAAADLAGQIRLVAARLGLAGPVVLGGGLGANVQRFQRSVAAALEPHGITEIRPLDREPVFGIDILAGLASPDAARHQ